MVEDRMPRRSTKLGEMYTAAGGNGATPISGHTANTLANCGPSSVSGNAPPADAT